MSGLERNSHRKSVLIVIFEQSVTHRENKYALPTTKKKRKKRKYYTDKDLIHFFF